MAGIVKSTTPTIRFDFKVVLVADIVKAYLTMKQQGALVVEKSLEDAAVLEKSLQWTLTQEETIKINPSRTICLQVKYKLNDGSVYASKIYEVPALDILKADVI